MAAGCSAARNAPCSCPRRPQRPARGGVRPGQSASTAGAAGSPARQRLRHRRGRLAAARSGAFLIRDPQGRQTIFGVAHPALQASGLGMPGRLQHVVFQTTELEAMIDFYVNTVGFTVSDNVVDEQTGQLMTCFLRSDDEHHTLAFFRGSKTSGTTTVTKPTNGMTSATGVIASPRNASPFSSGPADMGRATTCSSWWSMPIATAWSSRRSWKSLMPAASPVSGHRRNTHSIPGAAPGSGAEQFPRRLHP